MVNVMAAEFRREGSSLKPNAGFEIGEADGAFIANGFLYQASLLRGSQHRTGHDALDRQRMRSALLKRA